MTWHISKARTTTNAPTPIPDRERAVTTVGLVHDQTVLEVPSNWFTTEQLSSYMAVPVNTLLHWRKNATGPRYYKFGRSVRYAKADVDSWVASCAIGDPTGKPA